MECLYKLLIQSVAPCWSISQNWRRGRQYSVEIDQHLTQFNGMCMKNEYCSDKATTRLIIDLIKELRYSISYDYFPSLGSALGSLLLTLYTTLREVTPITSVPHPTKNLTVKIILSSLISIRNVYGILPFVM